MGLISKLENKMPGRNKDDGDNTVYPEQTATSTNTYDQYNTGDQYAGSNTAYAGNNNDNNNNPGLMSKIGDKLPGRNNNETDQYHQHGTTSSTTHDRYDRDDQYAGANTTRTDNNNNPGLMSKIEDKLPGRNKNETDQYSHNRNDQYTHTGNDNNNQGIKSKIENKLPGRNKDDTNRSYDHHTREGQYTGSTATHTGLEHPTQAHDRHTGSYATQTGRETHPLTQEYDPYTSQSQTSAAHGSHVSTGGFTNTYDSNASRNTAAGVGTQSNFPTDVSSAGGHNTSQQHYGRDAALGGGAAAVGAHEGRKHADFGDSTSSGLTGHGRDSDLTTHQHQQQTSSTGSNVHDSDHAKKLGGAYEAGYRDAMEHAKAEMRSNH